MKNNNTNKSINNSKELENEKLIINAMDKQSEGCIDEAKKMYQKIIDSGSKDLRVLTNLGVIYEAKGQLNHAIEYYKKSVDLFPKNANSYLNLGAIYKRIGETRQSEENILKAIQINPRLGRGYFYLGLILIEQGRLKEAAFYTYKAVILMPLYVDCYLNIGLIKSTMGQLKKAERSTRIAIKYQPKSPKNYSNLGIILKDQGNIDDAEKSLKKAIELDRFYTNAYIGLAGILRDRMILNDATLISKIAVLSKPDLAEAYLDLGISLTAKGKLKEAEITTLLAIKINPKLAIAYSNLGGIQKNQGRLTEAKNNLLKALEIDNNLARAYFSLTTLTDLSGNKELSRQILSTDIQNLRLNSERVDILFAKSNILHRKGDFNGSSRYLAQANNIKLRMYPANGHEYIENANKLLKVSRETEEFKSNIPSHTNCIFIVGMPRSGSTLIESILSVNPSIIDLQETNILTSAYQEWQDNKKKGKSLYELYMKRRPKNLEAFQITTDKMLFNYIYAGLLASQFKNVKIIHCFRHPLDNILSIYKANFETGYRYSSSLTDSANVLINKDNIMREYKRVYPSKIYELDYDKLVTSPNKEILSLIKWIGWEWNEDYLSPHLNKRMISTASNVQVRSPINPNSVGGWKHYKDLLKPALNIFANNGIL